MRDKLLSRIGCALLISPRFRLIYSLGRVSSISLLIVRIEMPANGSNYNPTSAVITVPDPDNCPSAVHVEKGGTLQWRNESRNYPDFEVEFIGANPVDERPNAIFTGHKMKPVVIQPEKIGDYCYKIRHKNADGACRDSGPSVFYVIPCTGC